MTTKRMKRKYEKPAMQVYEMRETPKILAGSGEGDRSPYDPILW